MGLEPVHLSVSGSALPLRQPPGHEKTAIPSGMTADHGADNGTRTRGLNLGKVALYQLSYVRKGFPP